MIPIGMSAQARPAVRTTAARALYALRRWARQAAKPVKAAIARHGKVMRKKTGAARVYPLITTPSGRNVPQPPAMSVPGSSVLSMTWWCTGVRWRVGGGPALGWYGEGKGSARVPSPSGTCWLSGPWAGADVSGSGGAGGVRRVRRGRCCPGGGHAHSVPSAPGSTGRTPSPRTRWRTTRGRTTCISPGSGAGW